MTALDEILLAEQEAESAITAAGAKAEAAVSAMKNDHHTRLEEESVRLKEVETKALSEKEKQVAEMIKKIEVTTADQVASLEGKFADKQTTLIAGVKKKFQ